MQKKKLSLKIKNEQLHAHSIHSDEKYSARVAKKIVFFSVLLQHRFGQLTPLPNHPHYNSLALKNVQNLFFLSKRFCEHIYPSILFRAYFTYK